MNYSRIYFSIYSALIRITRESIRNFGFNEFCLCRAISNENFNFLVLKSMFVEGKCFID